MSRVHDALALCAGSGLLLVALYVAPGLYRDHPESLLALVIVLLLGASAAVALWPKRRP